jgi:phosphoglycolate phosphatase-like HAD superfamily hydrolase
MRVIKAVLIEPVGCLAEFPAEEFSTIATRVFGLPETPDLSGSEAYWQLLDAIEQSDPKMTPANAQVVEDLERQAVARAHLYEDVFPALAEVQRMQIALLVASSLSAGAVSDFLQRFSLTDFFSGVWTRDNAGGVKTAPLAKAIEGAAVAAEHVMALVDTLDGMDVAKQVGANAMLMINDYDEGRRLVTHAPAGAIVSLHELPDAIRFVAEGAKVPRR